MMCVCVIYMLILTALLIDEWGLFDAKILDTNGCEIFGCSYGASVLLFTFLFVTRNHKLTDKLFIDRKMNSYKLIMINTML